MNESAENRNLKKTVTGGKAALPAYRIGVEHRVKKTLVIRQQQKSALFRDTAEIKRLGLEKHPAERPASRPPQTIPEIINFSLNHFPES
jgi:hypothetical protein